MKSIIVATDFSLPAENAMLYAGQLAHAINAPVLLLHVYQVPVSMAEVPVLMISAEELKNAADEGLSKAKQLLQNAFADLEIKTESRLGSINDELKDLAEEVQPFAIVVGKHGASGLERFLFGSTSLSIIRHTNIPVIVVPDTSTKKEIKNIALAIDDLKESIPQKRIRSFIENLQAQLQIIHVQKTKTSSKELDDLVSEMNATCKIIYDDEFFHGIESYLEENKIDMLMVLPHKHSFLQRLTFKTHTEELLQKIDIPLVCIHEE